MARTTGPLELAGCEIKSWTPKPAKFDAKGEQVEAPKLAITFHVDMEQVGPDMAQLAWWFNNDTPVTVTLDGIEQTRFSDAVHKAADAVHKAAEDMRPENIGDGIDSVDLSTDDGRRTTTVRRGERETART